MASRPASNPITHAPGLSKEELARRYTQWAEEQKYERDLEGVYNGPAIVVDVMVNLFPERQSRKDLSILDVAAGSGLVAEKLIQEGFEQFDALEPSEGLMNLAIAKRIYSKTFLTFITDTPTDIESDSYDVVIVCGAFGENHIPCSGLDEFIRLAKPGGHVVIVMSEVFLTSVLEYKDRLEPRMKRLEEEGKWVLIRRAIVPRYFDVYNGAVFVFQVSK